MMWLRRKKKPPAVTGATEHFIQAGLYDEWYAVSPTIEIMVRGFDPIGCFWIREISEGNDG